MSASVFPIGHIYDLVVADHGRQHAFVALASMLIAFLAIRTSARMTRRFSWWPGGVETAEGVHLHHFVWGIFLMIGAGFLGLGLHLGEPWGGFVAAVFGVGVGLTLDEFALWTRLQDVYWSQEGRSSLEAVAIVAAIGLLVVIGVRPFELDDAGSAVTVSVTIALSLAVAIVAILKGRVLLGAVGLFLMPVGLVGAVRLARPSSPWARRRYPADGERMRRARRRFERESRLSDRLYDAIGGAPSRR
jgi:ABC-type multidrug transport system fused ATPase/permease subunit